MRFYLINNRENEPSFIFVDKLEDIIYHVEGNIDDTVIVEGSRESKPFFLRDSDDIKTCVIKDTEMDYWHKKFLKILHEKENL